jgi:sec-independent protein translocase protein TatA
MGLDNPLHIAFLLVLLLLVFGAKRLPEMGRSLGDGMRGFKDALGGHASAPAVTPAAPQLVTQPSSGSHAAPPPPGSHAAQPAAPAAVAQIAQIAQQRQKPLDDGPAAA